jgi:NADH-quinone oxidoreductase subunit E
LREEETAMSIFLELGQRPDEPGPPITGSVSYEPDVAARLAEDAARIVARYPQARSALLPLLHLVQSEDGCLTPAGIAFCANRLGLTDAEVTAVATFYSMYRRTPTGDYLVGVCTNTLCAIMGGDEILDALQDHLGVPAGQTTDPAEGLATITLEHIECNAACDYAPVVMVNWEFFDNQTPASARDLVDSLRAGAPVAPTRGAPLCTFRDTARTLAGLTDPRTVTNPGGTGDATLAGLRVARANGMSAPDPASTEDEGTQPDPEITEAADSTRDEPAPAPTESVPDKPVDGSAP